MGGFTPLPPPPGGTKTLQRMNKFCDDGETGTYFVSTRVTVPLVTVSAAFVRFVVVVACAFWGYRRIPRANEGSGGLGLPGRRGTHLSSICC